MGGNVKTNLKGYEGKSPELAAIVESRDQLLPNPGPRGGISPSYVNSMTTRPIIIRLTDSGNRDF